MQQQIKPFKKNERKKAMAIKKDQQLSQKAEMEQRHDSVSDLMPI